MTQPYELTVLYNNEWETLDLDQSPAIVYQLNDLANLTDRQATFSQNLKLPKSQNNRRIFEHANVIFVDSDIPYTPLPCRLYCNGTQVIGRNFELVLNRKTEYFETQIVSSALDFFTQLAEQPIDEMQLGNIDYSPQGVANATANYPASSFHTWMLCNGTINQQSGYNFGTTLPINHAGRLLLKFLYPVINFRALVDLIIEEAGYELITDVPNQNDWIPCDRLVPEGFFPDFSNLVFKGSRSWYVVVDLPEPLYLFTGDIITDNAFGAGSEFTDIYGNVGVRYTALSDITVDYTYSVELSDNSQRTDDTAHHVYLIKRGDEGNPDAWDNLFENFDTMVPGRIISYAEEGIELQEGDSLFFWAALEETLAVGDGFYRPNVTVTPRTSTNDYAIPGSTIPLAPNIPFNTKNDVVKQYVQIYGLTVDVRQEDKQIFMYSMNRPYDLRDAGDYYDWSDKIHYDESDTLEFSIGNYGRLNRMLFANNSDEDFQDIGTFEINDRKLSQVYDAISVAFMSIRNVRLVVSTSQNPFDIANLPVYENEGETYRTQLADGSTVWVGIFTYQGMPLCIVRQNSTFGNISGEVYISELSDYSVRAEGILIGESFTAQKYLDTYFDRIINSLLYHAKALKARFDLQPEDVKDIDILKPVYISFLSSFFYISQIRSYIYGQLTQATLIKL